MVDDAEIFGLGRRAERVQLKVRVSKTIYHLSFVNYQLPFWGRAKACCLQPNEK
jgi:hypothetical protein